MQRIQTLERLVTLPIDPMLHLYRMKASCPVVGVSENAAKVDELLACLRGDPCCMGDVVDVLVELYPEHAATIQTKHFTQKPDTPFTFKCKNGDCVEPSTSMLRRRFHLIDDFIEDTGSHTMPIPYSVGEVVSCLRMHEWVLLRDHYECLMHLNPKSNLYPFYYSLDGIPSGQIEELANRMTKEEQRQLQLTAVRRGVALPCNDPVVLLAAFPYVLTMTREMRQLYRNRPGFFFTSVVHSGWYTQDLGLVLECLLTTDWSLDADSLLDANSVLRSVSKALCAVIELEDAQPHLPALLAMGGLRHPELLNMEKQVTLPFLLEMPPASEQDTDTLIKLYTHIEEGQLRVMPGVTHRLQLTLPS